MQPYGAQVGMPASVANGGTPAPWRGGGLTDSGAGTGRPCFPELEYAVGVAEAARETGTGRRDKFIAASRMYCKPTDEQLSPNAIRSAQSQMELISRGLPPDHFTKLSIASGVNGGAAVPPALAQRKRMYSAVSSALSGSMYRRKATRCLN